MSIIALLLHFDSKQQAMTDFIKKVVQNPKDDILAGITVSLAMI